MLSDKGQRAISEGPARVKLCRQRVLSPASSAAAEPGKGPANTALRNIIDAGTDNSLEKNPTATAKCGKRCQRHRHSFSGVFSAALKCCSKGRGKQHRALGELGGAHAGQDMPGTAASALASLGPGWISSRSLPAALKKSLFAAYCCWETHPGSGATTALPAAPGTSCLSHHGRGQASTKPCSLDPHVLHGESLWTGTGTPRVQGAAGGGEAR